jgi:osmoprotectant transport system ATP-binding protein
LSPETSAIRLSGVRKRFPGSRTDAIVELDLDMVEGSVTALVGPSGCGKTTTLRMINRLIEPTEGTVELFGRDVRSLPLHELRRGIGYVIQQAGLFPHRTVAGNIATVPQLLRWDKRAVRARVEELTDLVGLEPELLARYPAELSGGQQQRVGVARALAADPPVLLMDEPYSAVDPIVRVRLQDELLALQRRVHKTIVLVTHDVEEALKLADQVALLNVGGHLEQLASPDELLRAPASPFVSSFLGRERALRRLALQRCCDGAIGPVPDDTTMLPTVANDAPLREALDALVASGRDAVVVVDEGGVAIGSLDLAAITTRIGNPPVESEHS